MVGVGKVAPIAVIRILCEHNPSFGMSVVNGVLAWATVLGGFTAFCSGALASLLASDTTPADVRADLINRGLGVGYRWGMAAGGLIFVLFVARIVS
jgi:hypothetical protein